MRLCSNEWDALSEICKNENVSRNNLIETLENNKDENLGLTYSTRLFLLEYYRSKVQKKESKISIKRKNITADKNPLIMHIIQTKL